MRHKIEIDINQMELALLAEIDQAAEAVRGYFITNTPSQPAVYMAKHAEAEAFMLDQEISDVMIPNIAKEAIRLGTTKFAVAVSILTQAEIWRQVSAEIEDLRLGAKANVRAATTVAAKRQAAVIDWAPIISLAS
jgi:hypothetical protein